MGTVGDVDTINEELNQSMLSLEQAAANEFLSHVEQAQPRSEPEMNSITEQSLVEGPISEQVQIEQAPVEPMSPMSSILAARNQLRSQKKQQAQPTKKLNDANARLKNTAPSNENQGVNQASSNTVAKSLLSAANSLEQANPLDENKPDLAPVPIENYSADAIDPATVRLANQIDKWANMIDSMSLKGRIRQLAIHATICDSSTDNYLKLLLDQSTKHLKSNAAHQQLQAALSVFLQKKIVVDIEVVEKTVADPYQIKTHINDKRYDFAKELLLADDIVIRLQNEFQAVMNESTIMAR
jgi:DNA polymerase-3 subunit gamma/tau